MKNYSILRSLQYNNIQQLLLNGSILDVGGVKLAEYHKLIKGENEFTVINIDKNCNPDFFVDIEKSFPFDDNQFDHTVCFNVLEHVYEFEHVIREQLRCIKPGGSIVITTPFMHHIHGSPDDYMRYTLSTYNRIAEKLSCLVVKNEALGFGFFSLGYQCIGGAIPTSILRTIMRVICISLDKTLNKISGKYRKLTTRIPLGVFVILKKE